MSILIFLSLDHKFGLSLNKKINLKLDNNAKVWIKQKKILLLNSKVIKIKRNVKITSYINITNMKNLNLINFLINITKNVTN